MATPTSWITSAASGYTRCTPTTRSSSCDTMTFMLYFLCALPVSWCISGVPRFLYTRSFVYFAAASSSVRPHVPICGIEKTADATLAWSTAVGSLPKAVLATRVPSWIATGVSWMRSVTSPMAKMWSTFVLLNSSTMTPPLERVATPAFSRPRLAVLGLRPVAYMTQSKTSSAPVLKVTLRRPSAVFSILVGSALKCSLMPRASICVLSSSRHIMSKPRRKISPRYARCTSPSRGRKDSKMPANSTAMKPPPTTRVFLGHSGR
mmetsp:Transcript_1022/g.3416  ORF Transcript_1022/g.3416 Transcript_1022/m.3416 type:complete len:263 (+) Transcript_1022:376-1164(+)